MQPLTLGDSVANTAMPCPRRVPAATHAQLRMTVCIPFLWGVPPEVESLSAAIAAAGGIVHQVGLLAAAVCDSCDSRPGRWCQPPTLTLLLTAPLATATTRHTHVQVQKEWGIYRPRFRQQQARHTRSSSVSGCGSSGADWDVLC
jgi:hypothetical protein